MFNSLKQEREGTLKVVRRKRSLRGYLTDSERNEWLERLQSLTKDTTPLDHLSDHSLSLMAEQIVGERIL